MADVTDRLLATSDVLAALGRTVPRADTVICTKAGPNGGAGTTAGDSSHLGATSRIRFDAQPWDSILKYVEFANVRNSPSSAGEIPGANNILVKSAWEAAGAASSVPLYAEDGGRVATILPGKRAVFAPASPILVPGGSLPFCRQYVTTPAAGGTWPVNRPAHAATLGESDNTFGTGAGADVVDAVGTFGSASVVYAFGPVGLYGVPADGLRRKAVAIMGDSLCSASGAQASTYGDANGYTGFVEAALTNQVPFIAAPRSSSRLQWRAVGFDTSIELQLMGPYVTSVIIELSCNDWSTGRTLAQMQSDLATIVTAWQRYRVTVFVTTSTPKPLTTTNAWADGGASLQTAAEVVRQNYNTWLLTKPFGIRVFDVAAAVGDPARPGYWLPGTTAMTNDGTHLTDLGRTTAAATIDLNQLV